MPNKNKKKMGIIFGCFLFSISLLVFSFRGYIGIYVLKNMNITDAVIVGITEIKSQRSADKHVKATYEFYIDGETYTGESNTIKLIKYKENDIVKVYYNKQDPNHNDMLEGKGNIIIALFSIGVIIMSIYSMIRIKSNKIA